MKRWLIPALVGVAAAAYAGAFEAAPSHGATAARSLAAASTKLTICHKTANGWQRITVAQSAFTKPATSQGKVLRAHLMHVGDAVVVGTGACPSLSLTPSPASTPATRLTICHRTGSSSNPYRRITISSRAVTNPNSASGRTLRGHMGHTGDLLLPGASACPSGSPPGNQPTRLVADLRAVTGATGSGSFSATIRLSRKELCYTLEVSGLTNVTAAHIHRASNESIVVPLATPASGRSSGCVTVETALLTEIVNSPGAFYVNVHTQTYPGGQARGTLARR